MAERSKFLFRTLLFLAVGRYLALQKWRIWAPVNTYGVLTQYLANSFCERKTDAERRIWGTVCLEGVVQLYVFLLSPVASDPTNLMAVQEGPTGIRVSWIPPTPLGNTTGYRIYYSGGSSGSVDVSGGSTYNHLLTGLQNGAKYTIFIVAMSEHFFSNKVESLKNITLSELLRLVSVHEMCACPHSLHTQLLASQE